MSDPQQQSQTKSDALVIFGISGDLAKKMTFISLYHLAARGLLDLPVIGVAFSDWTDEDLRTHARQSIEASGTTIDDAVWKKFSANLSYIKGDYTKDDTYTAVKEALGSASAPLFYLEIPPGLFLSTVQGLHAADLLSTARVVIEKPFGHDYDSAVALYRQLAEMLREDQI